MSVAALLLAGALAAGAAPLRPERVVLRTDAGDLVLALYARAPRHAEKLLRLFRSGAYDTAPLVKLDPARFVHVGSVDQRKRPLDAAALARIQRLPLEPGAGPHLAGVLSMTRDPGDPDLHETSFVILLANIPVMDGRYSAVGEVAGGGEVLDALRRAHVDAQGRPSRPLLVRATEVFGSEAEAARAPLRGPDRAALGLDADDAFRLRVLAFAALAAAAAAALGLLGARLGRAGAAAALLCALAAFFGVFAATADAAARLPYAGALLFLGAVGCFRLMNEFER